MWKAVAVQLPEASGLNERDLRRRVARQDQLAELGFCKVGRRLEAQALNSLRGWVREDQEVDVLALDTSAPLVGASRLRVLRESHMGAVL